MAQAREVFSIVSELKIPICYIGVGEKADDLSVFDAKDYVRVMLESIFEG